MDSRCWFLVMTARRRLSDVSVSAFNSSRFTTATATSTRSSDFSNHEHVERKKNKMNDGSDDGDDGNGSTIYAMSTNAWQTAALNVLRISGPRAHDIAKIMTRNVRRSNNNNNINSINNNEKRKTMMYQKRDDDGDDDGEAVVVPNVMRRVKFVNPIVQSLRAPQEEKSFNNNGKKKEQIITRRNYELIDEGLIVYFKKPKSFTGEDVCEFHLHGSVAVTKKILDVLGSLNNILSSSSSSSSSISSNDKDLRIRPAEAGEFSKRAFLNKKMNLVQAESLADLIEAETEEQRVLALSEVDDDDDDHDHDDDDDEDDEHLYDIDNGTTKKTKTKKALSLTRKVKEWTKSITKALAICEAVIDFPGEDPKLEQSLILESVLPLCQKVKDEIDIALLDADARELIRNGVRVCIVGQTNAGKSTLLNYFAKRDVAIVSKIPGTTRDVVEVSLELEGRKVVIFDTAGHREFFANDSTVNHDDDHDDDDELNSSSTSSLSPPQLDDEYEKRVGKLTLNEDTKHLIDEIEREGIERGKLVARTADIIIEMIDATNPKRIDFKNLIRNRTKAKIISVLNKSDSLYLLDEDNEDNNINNINTITTTTTTTTTLLADKSLLRLSLRTGEGVKELTRAVSKAVEERTRTPSSASASSPSSSSTMITKSRTAALTRARHKVHCQTVSRSLLNASKNFNESELISDDLRECLRAFGKIIGKIDQEAVLDHLFAEFCIGK